MFRSITINLPVDIRQRLNYTSAQLLDLLAELMITKHEGKILVKPLRCTEYWLSERLNRSREWISKNIRKLELLGLIEVERTRQKDGKWGINVYMIGRRLLAIFGHFCQAFKNYLALLKEKFTMKNSIKPLNREIPVENTNIRGPDSDMKRLLDIIQRMTEKINAGL